MDQDLTRVTQVARWLLPAARCARPPVAAGLPAAYTLGPWPSIHGGQPRGVRHVCAPRRSGGAEGAEPAGRSTTAHLARHLGRQMIQMLYSRVIAGEAIWPGRLGRNVWRGGSVHEKPRVLSLRVPGLATKR